MKAILISIKPKWVAKILNGEKTIEIRKNMPKCELPIDVYIYCTKGSGIEKLYGSNLPVCGSDDNIVYFADNFDATRDTDILNGKVVAKFTLKRVGVLKYQEHADERSKQVNKDTCLTDEELDAYLGKETGYAWFIDDLEIFDKPKELSEFKVKKTYICKNCPPKYQYGVCLKDCTETLSLTKAPQSWQFIESEK